MCSFEVNYYKAEPPYNRLYTPLNNVQEALDKIDTYKEQTRKYFKENSLLDTKTARGFTEWPLREYMLGDLRYTLMSADSKIESVVIKRLNWLGKEIKDLPDFLEHIKFSDFMRNELNKNTTDFINAELSSGAIKKAFTTLNDIRRGPIQDYLDQSSKYCWQSYGQTAIYCDQVNRKIEELEQYVTEEKGITGAGIRSFIAGGANLVR